jgi:hypothetical protein
MRSITGSAHTHLQKPKGSEYPSGNTKVLDPQQTKEYEETMVRFGFAAKAFLFGLLMLTITFRANSQSTTGSVYGSVNDSTGAVIVGVQITLTDVHTNVQQKTLTNESGDFTFPAVKPSDYSVTTVATGFRSETQTGVSVSANQNVHVTFSLAAGSVSETVQVEAGITMVDTRESQLAETIEQARFQSLPTINRSTYDLVQTVPGVTNYSSDSQIGSRNGTNFSVNGLPSDMVSYYIDGAYNNTYKQGGGNKAPNPDALQEFRLITSNFDAEFGRTPGAVTNVITRSGTSSYHGDVYDYVRNDIFNAKPYFQTNVPAMKQHQFGGVFGGPVPSIRNTFFFGSFEQLIFHQPAVVNAGAIIIPTDLERKGNFTLSATKPKLPAGTNCGTVAAPVICAAALDPVAQNILNFVPHANSDGTSPQQSAQANSSSKQGLARIDYSGFNGHSVELMYFNAQGSDTAPLAGGNQIIGYSGMINDENQANGVLADTWMMNARAVNSARLFFSQNKYVIANQYQGHFLADLGSTAGEGGDIFAPPKMNVNGYFSAGTAGAGPSNISQVSMGVIDTITLMRGHHAVKFGGSYVRNRYNEDGGNTAGGTFGFANNSSVSGGTALSDFLLGKANNLNQSSSVRHRTHQPDPALYAQDTWQVTQRLSLNLGLRWEMFAPHCCEPTTTGTFVAGQQSTVVPNAPLGLLYQGDKGVPNGLFSTSKLNFAPRVGFAYDAWGNGQTSIRGGFGIFYQTIEQFNYGTMNQLPFSLSTTVNLTPNLVAPYSNVSGGDPYPFVYNPKSPRFADNATTQAVVPNTSAPYVYEYNVALEQQLNPKFAFRLAYVGNATRNNMINIDGNAPVYFPGAAVSTAAINCRRPYQPYRAGGVVNSATCTYSGFSGSAGTDPTAGKTFGSVNLRAPYLNGSYNSLQTNLRGRIGSKFNLQASYVWSKSLNYTGPTVDNTNLKRNYGPADEDIRQSFVASFIYHLPDIKRWGQVGRQALSGWQINGITNLSSGSPFIVTSGTDTNRDGTNNDRVNVIGDPYTHAKSRQDKIKAFLNPASFSVPGFATAADNPYGNEQRNSLVGPGSINTNLSLFKAFAIYREINFQFRAEVYNAFGNVNLNNPRTNFSVFSSPSTPTQITGSGAPRRLQFAAKIMF